MTTKLVSITLITSITIWVGCLLLILQMDSSDNVETEAEIINGILSNKQKNKRSLTSADCPPSHLKSMAKMVIKPEPVTPVTPPVVKRIDDGFLYASKIVKSPEQQQSEPQSEKDVIYESMYRCQPPKFNRTSPNPCWTSSKGKIYCAASVMLIGFHKTGSGDLSNWLMKDGERFASAPDDYFFHPHGNSLLYSDCPHKYLEEKTDQVSYMEAASSRGADKRIFVNCPGCLVIGHTVHAYPGVFIRRSTVQYIHYFTTPESRYIVSLRNPTERALSHYFSSFDQKLPYEFPEWKNITDVKEVGFGYLHRLLEEELQLIQQCYRELGVKQCVLDITSGAYRKQFALNLLIQRGCYIVFIREAMKFIPKEQIFFSLMETYSDHTEQVVTDMMTFIGVPPPTRKSFDENISHRESLTKSRPVDQKTRDLLDQFYKPFNNELAELLGDEKYLFKR